MVLHGPRVVQNFAAGVSVLGHLVALEEAVGLRFADDADLDLGRVHVYVELATDEESHGAREARVGLHDLGRLLLDDEGAGD